MSLFSKSAVTLSVALTLSCATGALAKESVTANDRIAVALESGSLANALNQYSRVAGITISYDQRALQGMRVAAVTGKFHVRELLNMLLYGTELHAVDMGNGAWLIEKKQPDLLVLDTIEVQGQRSGGQDQVYREASSVAIVDKATIERFRGTSVGDIFQGTTGVLVSENRNSGGVDINIRGMQGQGRVPVIVDGSRQETTVYRGYSGVSSRSYIDADLISTMRIDKGPVMSADGTGATGGLVSVTTLVADDIVKEGELFGVRVRASAIGNSSEAPEPGTYSGYYLPRNSYRDDCRFSSYCTDQFLMPNSFASESGMDRPDLMDLRSYAGSLALAKRFDWGDLILAYANRDQGNYYAGKNGPTPEVVIGEAEQLPWYKEIPVSLVGASRFRAEERIPNTNFANQSWLLKTNLYLPADQSLDLSYLRYDSQYGEMMPSQIKGFGQARQWLDSEVLNQTYTAKYRWTPVDMAGIDLKANLWHTDTTTVLNTPGVGSIDLEDNVRRTDDYQRLGADISNQMTFYPLGELQLEYGIAAQWESMDTDTPQEGGFYSGSRSGDRSEFSGFVSGRWQPWQAWVLEAGLRYTQFRSKDNNSLELSKYDPACKPDGEGGCMPVHYRNNRSGTAPVVALTWQPLEGLQLYLRYAEALRMPSLFESTSGWSVSPALDIPLKPEHSKNREVGMNYLKQGVFGDSDQFKVKLAYFRNHVDDYLTRTQPNAWEVTNGAFDFFRMRNIDSLELHGFEANITFDADLWFVELSGTKYNHIEVCNVGSYVRNYCNDWGLPQSYINNMIPPNWHANAHLGVRLLQQKLELGARGTFMGERNSIPRYNAPAGFNAPVLWHSYNLLDLYASYQVTDSLSMDFSIDNVTDRYYLDALSLGLVPAPGRTARVSVTWQF